MELYERVVTGNVGAVLLEESGSVASGAAEKLMMKYRWPRGLKMLALGAEHPTKKYMLLADYDYSRLDQDYYEVTYNYLGADFKNLDDPNEEKPDPDDPDGPSIVVPGDGSDGVAGYQYTYTCDVMTVEESIVLHEDWKRWDKKKLGAQFDERGLFIGFSMDPEYAEYDMGGVTKFVSGGMTFTRTCTMKKGASAMFKKIGTISSPGAGAPSVQGRNWLYMGGTIKSAGNANEVSEKWMLSGNGGWNKHIYNK